MAHYWELPPVYDIGVAPFFEFPRALYPPSHPKGPVQNGPDVEALKIIAWYFGRWATHDGQPDKDPNFDQGYSEQFAKGKGANVGDSGILGLQRQAGVAGADGVVGQRTFDLLIYQRIPKGLPNQGKFPTSINQHLAALLRQAAELFPKDEPADAPAAGNARDTIVQTGMLGVDKAEQIHYTQDYRRMWGVREQVRPDDVPPYEDCSSFATWCYWVAGAPDPNGLGYNGSGYTGTQVNNGRSVGLDGRRPGDLIFYGGSWSSTSHVAIFTSDTSCVVSHGSEGGPYYCEYNYRSDIVGVRSYL
jgi:hypothetical protein